MIAVYLLWLLPRPRVVGPPRLQIALPTARMTARADRNRRSGSWRRRAARCTPCFPPSRDRSDHLLVIFATALLLGFLSHAPGSLGVIEAAMLHRAAAIPEGGIAGVAADLPCPVFPAAGVTGRSLLGVREFLLIAGSTRLPGSR